MSQFSTNEAISLEKRVNISSNLQKTNLEDINQTYEIDKCVKFIQDNNYNKVCLQFPDYLLPDSVEIVHRLEAQINRKVYVLGDTAYGSCCIDFTAAKHIPADCIIHFGGVCSSKPETVIPFLSIYEKFDLNVGGFCARVCDQFTGDNCVVVIDTPYLHKIQEVQRLLSGFNVCSIEHIDGLLSGVVLYLGQNDRKLMNVYLQHKPANLYYFDPKSAPKIIDYIQDTKILKRRHFLAEKIKDSQTFGIVLSTLAVANYLQILERTINLIKLHEKKYYIISVGKPNVAKLANFPEIDVFVVIGCSMNEIYESRDFFKPIVTVFDLEIALNSDLSGATFTYDFNDVLGNKIRVDLDESDVSLLSGKIRNRREENVADDCDTADNQLVVRPEGKLALTDKYGAGFLATRSWQGLDQDLGKTDVNVAVPGRKGIPLSYDNEIQ